MRHDPLSITSGRAASTRAAALECTHWMVRLAYLSYCALGRHRYGDIVSNVVCRPPQSRRKKGDIVDEDDGIDALLSLARPVERSDDAGTQCAEAVRPISQLIGAAIHAVQLEAAQLSTFVIETQADWTAVLKSDIDLGVSSQTSRILMHFPRQCRAGPALIDVSARVGGDAPEPWETSSDYKLRSAADDTPSKWDRASPRQSRRRRSGRATRSTSAAAPSEAGGFWLQDGAAGEEEDVKAEDEENADASTEDDTSRPQV